MSWNPLVKVNSNHSFVVSSFIRTFRICTHRLAAASAAGGVTPVSPPCPALHTRLATVSVCPVAAVLVRAARSLPCPVRGGGFASGDLVFVFHLVSTPGRGRKVGKSVGVAPCVTGGGGTGGRMRAIRDSAWRPRPRGRRRPAGRSRRGH